MIVLNNPPESAASGGIAIVRAGRDASGTKARGRCGSRTDNRYAGVTMTPQAHHARNAGPGRVCYARLRVLILFYILAIQQLLQGIYSAVQGVVWLRFVRRRLATHAGFYSPRVAVICPCKGVDPGLESNLQALTHFDYPNYEIIFVV